MKNQIILHVTKEDILGAKSFSASECILTRAVQRQFNNPKMKAGIVSIHADGEVLYSFPWFGSENYRKAKANPEPFDIILTPVE